MTTEETNEFFRDVDYEFPFLRIDSSTFTPKAVKSVGHNVISSPPTKEYYNCYFFDETYSEIAWELAHGDIFILFSALKLNPDCFTLEQLKQRLGDTYDTDMLLTFMISRLNYFYMNSKGEVILALV